MIAYRRKNADRTKLPAVFLDRDGTIIHDRPGFYLTDPVKLRIYKTAFKALKILSGLGYRLIVLTNQSGVGRGYMTLAGSIAVNLELRRRLAEKGIALEGIYFCPHLPSAGCVCRKPGGGLVREALKGHRLDLARSVVIGDKASDMRLADSFGLASVLVRTGHGRSQLLKHPELAAGRAVKKDLLQAALWVAKLRPKPRSAVSRGADSGSR